MSQSEMDEEHKVHLKLFTSVSSVYVLVSEEQLSKHAELSDFKYLLDAY